MSQTSIGAIMEEASTSLVQMAYAKCERLCLKALQMATQDKDYDSAARILMPLQEARRQRRQIAIDAGVFVVGEPREPIADILKRHPCGCILLIDPPYATADAEALTAAARQEDLHVEVICLDDPSRRACFEQLMEQQGDRMLASASGGATAADRFERLCAALAKVGDHELAHQQTAAAAREAARP
jgi:hypothetical protein